MERSGANTVDGPATLQEVATYLHRPSFQHGRPQLWDTRAADACAGRFLPQAHHPRRIQAEGVADAVGACTRQRARNDGGGAAVVELGVTWRSVPAGGWDNPLSDWLRRLRPGARAHAADTHRAGRW